MNAHGMKVQTALVELFKEAPEWRTFFRACCEDGTLSAHGRTSQFRDELRERNPNQKISLEEVEDALLTIARKVLPDSPSAQWDPEWATDRCRDALSRLAEYYAERSEAERGALDLSGQDVWEERMQAAGVADDPAAFRAAVKGWERAGLEALARVREGPGRSAGAA